MPVRKNSFRSPEFREEIVLDQDGGIVGTIRINPAAVKWKPKSAHKFYSVPLPRFVEWISGPDSGARLTKS